jgi:hypothetical protein
LVVEEELKCVIPGVDVICNCNWNSAQQRVECNVFRVELDVSCTGGAEIRCILSDKVTQRIFTPPVLFELPKYVPNLHFRFINQAYMQMLAYKVSGRYICVTYQNINQCFMMKSFGCLLNVVILQVTSSLHEDHREIGVLSKGSAKPM